MASRGGFLRSYARLPLIPPPPSPTRGEGGVWASQTPALERGRRLGRHRSAHTPRLCVHCIGSRGGAKARRYVHFISEGQTGCLPSVLIRGLFFSACGRGRAPHSSSWVRAPTARISAASTPGARASGAQAGGDARAPRTLRPSPAGASRCSARASARSLRMRARRPRSRASAKGRPVARHSFPQRLSQRSNLVDRVEHSRNRAANTVTEMKFGLRSAGNGRFVRHGRRK